MHVIAIKTTRKTKTIRHQPCTGEAQAESRVHCLTTLTLPVPALYVDPATGFEAGKEKSLGVCGAPLDAGDDVRAEEACASVGGRSGTPTTCLFPP